MCVTQMTSSSQVITKELLESEVLPIVEAFMVERSLQLSTEKTMITHIDNGFDFFGQNLRKYDDKIVNQTIKEKREEFSALYTKL